MTMRRLVVPALILSAFAIVLVGSAWLLKALLGPVGPVEVERIPDPSRILEAVVATRDAGATTSTAYEVYLVPAGGSLASEPVFRADRVQGPIKPVWASDSELTIVADQARLFLHRRSVGVYVSPSQIIRVVTTLQIRVLDKS